MWVYWGKVGHLKTSSQEGAVLEPQLQGTQRVEAGGGGREQNQRKMCSGPFYWPLGGIVLILLQGAGQLTALDFFLPNKLP